MWRLKLNFELAKSEARSLHHECLLIVEMAFLREFLCEIGHDQAGILRERLESR